MTRLNVTNARRAALFASQFQRSDAPAADAVAEAISRTVRQFGVRGCASRMAQEFGDHPEAARDRMQWILQLVGEVPAPSARILPSQPPGMPAAPPEHTGPARHQQVGRLRLLVAAER